MLSPGRIATWPCQASDEAYDVATAALAKAQQAEYRHRFELQNSQPQPDQVPAVSSIVSEVSWCGQVFCECAAAPKPTRFKQDAAASFQEHTCSFTSLGDRPSISNPAAPLALRAEMSSESPDLS